jgi:hypothetical protein
LKHNISVYFYLPFKTDCRDEQLFLRSVIVTTTTLFILMYLNILGGMTKKKEKENTNGIKVLSLLFGLVNNSSKTSFHICITFISLQNTLFKNFLLKNKVKMQLRLKQTSRCFSLENQGTDFCLEHRQSTFFPKANMFFLFRKPRKIILSRKLRDCFLLEKKWFFLFRKPEDCFLFRTFSIDSLKWKTESFLNTFNEDFQGERQNMRKIQGGIAPP